MGRIMSDPKQAVGMIQGQGYAARAGHILKAVLGANWHLSTRLPGGRPVSAHSPLTIPAPAWQRLSHGLSLLPRRASITSDEDQGQLQLEGDLSFQFPPCPKHGLMNRRAGLVLLLDFPLRCR
jgi:hypothetical protein